MIGSLIRILLKIVAIARSDIVLLYIVNASRTVGIAPLASAKTALIDWSLKIRKI